MKKLLLFIIFIFMFMQFSISVQAERNAICVYEKAYDIYSEGDGLGQFRLTIKIDENNRLTYLNECNFNVLMDATWIITEYWEPTNYKPINAFLKCPDELTESECAGLAETEKALFCPSDIILNGYHVDMMNRISVLPTFDEADRTEGVETAPLKVEDSSVINLIYQSNNNEGDSDNGNNESAPPIISENERLYKCSYLNSGISIEYYSDGSIRIPNTHSQLTNHDVAYSFMGDPKLYADGNCPDIWTKTELENTIERIYIYTKSQTDEDCDDYSNFVDHYNQDGLVESFVGCDRAGYVPGDNLKLYLCEEDGVKQSFQVIGYLLFCLKIAIPLILIGLGILDFSKALISDDDKVTKEVGVKFAKRIISGVVIFFIPTVLNFIFSLVEGVGDIKEKYEGCTMCLFNPTDETKCKFEKVGFNDDSE